MAVEAPRFWLANGTLNTRLQASKRLTHAQLVAQVPEPTRAKTLGEDVGCHVLRRAVLDTDVLLVLLVAHEVVSNVDVLDSAMLFRVLRHLDAALVVLLDRRRALSESQLLQQRAQPESFPHAHRESHVLCLTAAQGDHVLLPSCERDW